MVLDDLSYQDALVQFYLVLRSPISLTVWRILYSKDDLFQYYQINQSHGISNANTIANTDGSPLRGDFRD